MLVHNIYNNAKNTMPSKETIKLRLLFTLTLKDVFRAKEWANHLRYAEHVVIIAATFETNYVSKPAKKSEIIDVTMYYTKTKTMTNTQVIQCNTKSYHYRND